MKRIFATKRCWCFIIFNLESNATNFTLRFLHWFHNSILILFYKFFKIFFPRILTRYLNYRVNNFEWSLQSNLTNPIECEFLFLFFPPTKKNRIPPCEQTQKKKKKPWTFLAFIICSKTTGEYAKEYIFTAGMIIT